MDIQYYAFALFVAALICLIAVLFRLLFAGVKRQRKMLDEKESDLLKLYRTVENIMEEFNDQIKTAMDDIKEYEVRTAAHMAAMAAKQEQERKAEAAPKPPVTEAPARAMTIDSSRIRAASEVLERAERMIKSNAGKGVTVIKSGDAGNHGVIQRLFDEPAGEPQSGGAETAAKNKRRESILALAREGKTHAQIAKELSITQNEVKLVIGLNGKS